MSHQGDQSGGTNWANADDDWMNAFMGSDQLDAYFNNTVQPPPPTASSQSAIDPMLMQLSDIQHQSQEAAAPVIDYWPIGAASQAQPQVTPVLDYYNPTLLEDEAYDYQPQEMATPYIGLPQQIAAPAIDPMLLQAPNNQNQPQEMVAPVIDLTQDEPQQHPVAAPDQTAGIRAHSAADEDIIEIHEVEYTPYRPRVPPCPNQNNDDAGEGPAVLASRTAGFRGLTQTSPKVRNTVPNVWVEVLTPKDQRHEVPVVMVHGDHHTGSVWDVDLVHTQESRTWAECFLGAGYQVHLVDLPGTRQSVGALAEDTRGPQQQPWAPLLCTVEANLTGVGNKSPFMYDSAWRHVGFPGAEEVGPLVKPGWRQDPVFEDYAKQRVGVWGRAQFRVIDGAAAVISVMEGLSAKAVLVAEGTGCEVAMLAADERPDLVASILAVGVPNAPFAKTTSRVVAHNHSVGLQFTGDMMTMREMRAGIFDVPPAFDPQLPGPGDVRVFETAVHTNEDGDQCLLQDPAKTVRKLPGLAKVPVAIMTAEASINSGFDWAVVKFLEEVGVKVEWLKLAEFGIFGNGPLLWLEKSAAQSGELAVAWATKNTSTDPDEVAAAAALLAPSPKDVAVARERRREDRERANARSGVDFIAKVEFWSARQGGQMAGPFNPVDKYIFSVGLGYLIPPAMAKDFLAGNSGPGGGGGAGRGVGLGAGRDDDNSRADGREHEREDGDGGSPGRRGGRAN